MRIQQFGKDAYKKYDPSIDKNSATKITERRANERGEKVLIPRTYILGKGDCFQEAQHIEPIIKSFCA